MTNLVFARDAKRALKDAELIVHVAPKAFYADGWLARVATGPWVEHLDLAARKCNAATDPEGVCTLTGKATAHAIVLPEKISRHNSPSRSEAIATALARAGISGQKAVIIIGLAEDEHMMGAATAVARSLPLFTRKNGKSKTDGQATLIFTHDDGHPVSATSEVKEVVEGVRWAASTVDTHPAEMTTAIFAREAKKLVRGLKNVRATEIIGPKLLEQKLNGLHAVGRSGEVPPRLLVLDYKPLKANKTLALVGKGVIYDTGGLSLKIGGNMCTMKSDMGGAAAVTAAFRALAAGGCEHRVICVVPLAENAIGPNAYRNDDIIKMHSGKTVEINNTDAEGRILLADAVSYVTRKYKPDAVIDAATLTGAQLVATGYRHAGVVSNREGLECLAVDVGLATGDLVHPLPFAPEFFQAEFKSTVADMKNSVANRSNAQSSCAAQFIYSHIADVDPAWLHIDLAGPSFRDGRATGYGVALMSRIVLAF